MLADVEFCTYMYIYSYQSNLYGSHPIVLITKQTMLIQSDIYFYFTSLGSLDLYARCIGLP